MSYSYNLFLKKIQSAHDLEQIERISNLQNIVRPREPLKNGPVEVMGRLSAVYRTLGCSVGEENRPPRKTPRSSEAEIVFNRELL